MDKEFDKNKRILLNLRATSSGEILLPPLRNTPL